MQHLLYHFQIKSPLAFERPLGLLLWNNFRKMLGKNSLTCQTYIPGYLKCSRCHFFSSFTEQKSLEEDKLSCDGVSQLPWWTVVLLHSFTGSHYVPFNLATSSGEIQMYGPVQSEVFFKSAQPCYKTLFCWYQTTEQLVSSGCEMPQFILILRNKSRLNFRIQPREHWNPTQHTGNSQSFSLIVPFTYLGIRLESSGLNSDCFITCQNSLFYISCIFCFSSQVLLRIF